MHKTIDQRVRSEGSASQEGAQHKGSGGLATSETYSACLTHGPPEGAACMTPQHMFSSPALHSALVRRFPLRAPALYMHSHFIARKTPPCS